MGTAWKTPDFTHGCGEAARVATDARQGEDDQRRIRHRRTRHRPRAAAIRPNVEPMRGTDAGTGARLAVRSPVGGKIRRTTAPDAPQAPPRARRGSGQVNTRPDGQGRARRLPCVRRRHHGTPATDPGTGPTGGTCRRMPLTTRSPAAFCRSSRSGRFHPHEMAGYYRRKTRLFKSAFHPGETWGQLGYYGGDNSGDFKG